MDKMTSCKPYLVRGVYEWILDNNCTPYLLVDAEYPMVQVPREYVKDGQIVLNTSPQSTGNFVIGDDDVQFNARFGGQPRHIIVPIGAVLFLYAKETGEGMPFPPEPHPEAEDAELGLDAQAFDENEVQNETETKADAEKPAKLTALKSVAKSDAKSDQGTDSEDVKKEANKEKKKSHLKVIK